MGIHTEMQQINEQNYSNNTELKFQDCEGSLERIGSLYWKESTEQVKSFNF